MDYSILVCTPRSVQTKIVEKILTALSHHFDFNIILRKTAELTIEDIEVMYPRLVTQPVFKQLAGCLMAGKVECVLVTAKDIHQKINAVKGYFRHDGQTACVSGLRAQFRKDERSFDFIFHSTDSNAESDLVGVRLFGEGYNSIVYPSN